jgi:protein ImuB
MFACIYIPDFPVAAIVRAEPSLRDHAIAVLDGRPPQARVAALNDKARLLGMEIGMTKLQAAIFTAAASQRTPAEQTAPRKPARQIEFAPQRTKPHPRATAAVLRQRSPAQEDSAHAALLDVAHAFTPRVEDTHADRLLLDLDGLERLYGPAAAMARELASRVSTVGLECNLGLAVNPDAAMHAACGFTGVTVIPSGDEAKRLGVLPITVLLDSFDIAGSQTAPPEADREREKRHEQMLDTLERWGVRDFRTLALLPEHALAARLGAAGTRLQQLARGAHRRTLALCGPRLHFEEALEPESSVETLEPLSFLLNRMLDRMCARLETRALAVQELTLRLQLEPRVADEQTTTLQELEKTSGARDLYTRTLRLPVAMRDPRVFLKLLQLDLDANPPGAPVCKLWLAAEPARPRMAQRGLFLPVTPEAEKLEITLARITGVVGERRAGIARLLDRHRPDAFRMERFVAQPGPGDNSTLTLSGIPEVPPLALRLFRPPRPVRVQLAEGRPCRLAPSARKEGGDELQGKVTWSAGPWHSSGDWWAEQPAVNQAAEEPHAWSREEWDIALAADGDVTLYRIYRDAGSGQWFADASYD